MDAIAPESPAIRRSVRSDDQDEGAPGSSTPGARRSGTATGECPRGDPAHSYGDPTPGDLGSPGRPPSHPSVAGASPVPPPPPVRPPPAARPPRPETPPRAVPHFRRPRGPPPPAQTAAPRGSPSSPWRTPAQGAPGADASLPSSSPRPRWTARGVGWGRCRPSRGPRRRSPPPRRAPAGGQEHRASGTGRGRRGSPQKCVCGGGGPRQTGRRGGNDGPPARGAGASTVRRGAQARRPGRARAVRWP